MIFNQKSMRKWLKRHSRKAWAIRILKAVVANYMRLVYLTARKKIEIHPRTKELMGKGVPLLIGNWHSRLFLAAPFWRRHGHSPLFVISSPHADGQIFGGAAELLGIKILRGTRGGEGGSIAMRAGIRALKSGNSLILNPDGPSGPRQVLGEGTAALAQISRSPFVCLTYSGRPVRFSKQGWDRSLVVPLFSKLTFRISAPMEYDETVDREQVRSEIETLMNQEMWALDQEYGHPRVVAEKCQ